MVDRTVKIWNLGVYIFYGEFYLVILMIQNLYFGRAEVLGFFIEAFHILHLIFEFLEFLSQRFSILSVNAFLFGLRDQLIQFVVNVWYFSF